MKIRLFIIGLACVFIAAMHINHDFKVPDGWPKPVYNFSKNPLSPQKIQIGRILFYDPVLSHNNMVSCASCHSPFHAFTHIDHALSHGIDDRIGTRNSPALINLAWQNKFMWDGAIHHLDMQALAPITHPDEMGSSIDSVIFRLNKRKRYRELFQSAYGDSAITGERVLKCLSQFMLTLVSADSKYDKVMRHEQGLAFTENEQKGYRIFKANCASCHTEPLFTKGGFENNGLEPDTSLQDAGRMKITGKAADAFKFKVPTLRNCELTYPYMHDGRFRNLQMVLFHYTHTVHESLTLSASLRKKIILSELEKGDLIAFLKTLTDEAFVRNPDFGFMK